VAEGQASAYSRIKQTAHPMPSLLTRHPNRYGKVHPPISLSLYGSAFTLSLNPPIPLPPRRRVASQHRKSETMSGPTLEATQGQNDGFFSQLP